ncbi:MAG: cytochrome c3 family protein [Thermodesulfovibrionales bacterium]|nr:cytochrome c3 family protein [Thermodesulfovibrionales bacterium]
MKKLTPWIIGGIFAVTIAVVIVATLMLRHKAVPEGKFKNMVGATYVGADECKKCHERKYLEWSTTLHSKMMQDAKANPQVIIGDFRSPSRIRTFKKDDVDYALGSQWKQQYLKKAGDDYEVLPAIYHISSNKWVEAPQKKSWFKECAGCHATGVDLVKKTFKDPGISCEACHGPGSNHIKAIPGFEIATTVNPVRLTSAQAAQICGSCHSRGMDTGGGHHAYPVEYMSVRGTGNLFLHFNIFDQKNNPELFWPSGDAKYSYMQYADWKQSEHAKNGITCTSCHLVHKSTTTFQTKLEGDMLCKSCHAATNNRMAHKIHTFGSCIACHMPKTGTSAEAGDIRSHTFKFISPELSLKRGGVQRQPNSCSGCHHHKDTPLEDMVEFLDAAKKTDMPLPFSAHRRQAKKE